MQQKVFDVVIVGSGASGGTMAAHLARAGVDVCVVEGGPRINTRTDFNTHALPSDFLNRHIPVMKPGKAGFESERSRGLGGKSLTWNAVAWRYSQRDFKGKRHDDGAGEDWPIDYSDLSPYYDRIEREVGVCGNRDGLEDLPDGLFLPPVPMKCSDLLVKRGAAKLGIKVIHVRKSTLSKPMSGRPACHFCGNCMAGCDVVAKYNSYDVHMRPALSTGKLTLMTDSVVREVTINDENRVTGIKFINRTTKAEGEVRGRVVAVTAACAQTIALLLMSKSRLYPNGLANSSGELGKNFIPHFTGGVQVFLKDLIGKPAANDEGFLDHAYVPSFMHNRKRDYARSFGVQFNYQNRRAVGWARDIPGFGADYKKAVKERYPAFLTFSPYGEQIPNKNTYVDLDYDRRDAYGLPVARRVVTWEENDWRIFRDMTRWSQEILLSAGAEILSVSDQPQTNHELGGARMGSDAKRSVVNQYCQSHDVPNLYVCDGSVFPSASEKNPTHTIMALAARTADHIAETLKGRGIVMAERRDALKIIGAIGATCAFPFSADELYGQHTHGPEAVLPKPTFFAASELAVIAKIAELIIPRTDTPGAVDAQVPAYIDYVCSRNATLAATIRDGLTALPNTVDVALLTKLDTEHSPFFVAMKNLTADGYYTSRIGLMEELGYKGNSVLAAFPVCEIPEH